MITITNSKVKGLEPKWSEYRGFSLLMNNPNPKVNLLEIKDNLYKISCSFEDSKIVFYKLLKESLDKLDVNILTNTYLFCPLPFSSFHVTFLDGISEDNMNKLNLADIASFKEFLSNIPKSIITDTYFTHFNESNLSEKLSEEVIFEYDKLTKWGNKVLVARLKPTKESRKSFQLLCLKRRTLLEEYLKSFGISKPLKIKKSTIKKFKEEQVAEDIILILEQELRDKKTMIFDTLKELQIFLERKTNKKQTSESINHIHELLSDFSPHVSLGYFGNLNGGELASSRLEDWNTVFKKKLENITINFSSISLYTFTDMATYLKRDSI